MDLRPGLAKPAQKNSSSKTIVIPSERIRYLAEISSTIRDYHQKTSKQAEAVRQNNHLQKSAEILAKKEIDDVSKTLELLKSEAAIISQSLENETEDTICQWGELKKGYSGDELVYSVRGKEIRVPLFTESLSHSKIPKISLPKFSDPADIYCWMRKENLPGYLPFDTSLLA